MSNYQFSVVIPIYNVEAYLEETIQSVLNQTIGFTQHIQMILVNDGSPDDCESICLRYQERYPENILYIRQENAGVSAARNNGLRYAEGEYVNFLDSDDKWEPDAFARVRDFLAVHREEVDFVACRMKFFEAESGFGHVLDYKFHSDRVIDVREEYDCVQMHCTSAFIRRSAIDTAFNTKLKFTEDSLFVNQIILKKCRYGAMRSAVHLYRKRRAGNSAVDTWKLDPASYSGNLREYDGKLLDCSREVCGEVIPYVQFVLMYELQWRLKARVPHTVLTDEEFAAYRDGVKALLAQIDDAIILQQRYLTDLQKLHTLVMKHGYDILDCMAYENGVFSLDGQTICSIGNETAFCTLQVIHLNADEMEICGALDCPLPLSDCVLYTEVNGERLTVSLTPYEQFNRSGTDDNKFFCEHLFHLHIPLTDGACEVRFLLQYREQEPLTLRPDFGIFGRLSRRLDVYYQKDRHMLVRKGESILCRPYSPAAAFRMRLTYTARLLTTRRLKPLVYRSISGLMRLLRHRPTWLVIASDSTSQVDMVQQWILLRQQKALGAKIYFACDNRSEQYHTAQQHGKVLSLGSLGGKLRLLSADRVIADSIDKPILNPFGGSQQYYRDLYRFDFTYLTDNAERAEQQFALHGRYGSINQR